MTKFGVIKSFYIENPPLVLPYKCQHFEFTMTQLSGECSQCNTELVNVHGKIRDYENCLEVDAVGICPVCVCLVKMHKIRYYKDGHSDFHDGDGWYKCGTIRVDGIASFLRNVIKRVKRLFR